MTGSSAIPYDCIFHVKRGSPIVAGSHGNSLSSIVIYRVPSQFALAKIEAFRRVNTGNTDDCGGRCGVGTAFDQAVEKPYRGVI